MKIVYITYSGKELGPRIHIAGFLESFRKLVPELKVYHLHPDFRDPLKEPEKAEADDSGSWPGRRREDLISKLYTGTRSGLLWEAAFLLRNLRCFAPELRIISRDKPDLLLVRKSFVVSSLFAAKLKQIPVVWEINAPLFEKELFVERKIPFPSLLKRLETKTNQWADALIVVSRPLKEHFLESGVPAERIFVNPNGVNPDRFSPEISPQRIRRKWGLEGKLLIGFSGGFRAWHGIDSFLEAVPPLSARYPEVLFLLMGDAVKETYLGKLKAPSCDRVIFTGLVPHIEIPEWLAAVDVVVAPYPPMASFYFSPLKVFEYMSMAKPVVASRQGQLAELIEDGVNGLLFEPGNQKEMIQKIKMLLDDAELRLKLGREARRKILEGYTWRHNAQRALEVCRQVMSRKGKGTKARLQE